jgi:hypothetical protein
VTVWHNSVVILFYKIYINGVFENIFYIFHNHFAEITRYMSQWNFTGISRENRIFFLVLYAYFNTVFWKYLVYQYKRNFPIKLKDHDIVLFNTHLVLDSDSFWCVCVYLPASLLVTFMFISGLLHVG